MRALDGENFHSSAIVSLPRVRTAIDSHSSAQTTSYAKSTIVLAYVFLQVEKTLIR
jgi:hypothetical protein